jgi:transposase
MPALVATRFNVDLKINYQTMVTAEKPREVAITAIMRKLIVLANTLLKADRNWINKPA